MSLIDISKNKKSFVSNMNRLAVYKYLLCIIMLVFFMVSPALADVVFTDDFNYEKAGQLKGAWDISYTGGMKKNDWKYTLKKPKSSLVVTDILDRSINKKWSTVTLSRNIDQLTDFDINLAFSWDIGRGKKINRAVQTFSLNLYDTDNNLLSSIGYRDLNTDTTGSKFVSIGNMSPYLISADGSSGKENVSLSRGGDTLSVAWDNWGTFSGTSSGNLSRVEIQFAYSKMKGKKISSYFGTESVDYINIQGTPYNNPPVVPEPVSSTLFIAGGALIAGRLYFKKRRQ